MKPVTAPTAATRAPLRAAGGDAWKERSGRLFAEFERPAKSMVRRAFRGAFGDDELDDIYAGAWVGTLRALAERHQQLADDEVRSYVLTAVANQASRELRRRRRKPTAPLELVAAVPDHSDSPEELATSREQSRVARDVLASLPPRRRAVMLLRYGWGLEPKHVCNLITGLSPRAYRKEVTRGVDEMTAKIRAVETGEWCDEREPLLKAFVAGLADEDQTRQARAHLAHCRHCSDFVARLSGHLHDLGGAVAIPGAIDGIDGHLAAGDRLVDLGHRVTGLFSRSGAGPADDAAAQIAASGGARGAGAAGAGLLTKLAGLGTAGKIALACIGGGMAATACIATGVTPLTLGGDADQGRSSANDHSRAADHRKSAEPAPTVVTVETLPSLVDNQSAPPPPNSDAEHRADTQAAPSNSPTQTTSAQSPIADSTPPVQQEFGVAAAAVPAAPAPPAPSATGGGASSGSASAVEQEFGP